MKTPHQWLGTMKEQLAVTEEAMLRIIEQIQQDAMQVTAGGIVNPVLRIDQVKTDPLAKSQVVNPGPLRPSVEKLYDRILAMEQRLDSVCDTVNVLFHDALR